MLYGESGGMPYVKSFITSQFLYDSKGLNFIASVVVIDSTHEMVVLSVISQPTCAIVELSTIAKIGKYRGLHERHHFIPMARRCMMHLGVIWIV
jgi:hypothetical protein